MDKSRRCPVAIATVNPTTGQWVQRFEPLTDQVLAAKLDLADRAFHAYQTVPIAQRAAWLNQVADRLETDCEALARLAVCRSSSRVFSG